MVALGPLVSKKRDTEVVMHPQTRRRRKAMISLPSPRPSWEFYYGGCVCESTWICTSFCSVSMMSLTFLDSLGSIRWLSKLFWFWAGNQSWHFCWRPLKPERPQGYQSQGKLQQSRDATWQNRADMSRLYIKRWNEGDWFATYFMRSHGVGELQLCTERNSRAKRGRTKGHPSVLGAKVIHCIKEWKGHQGRGRPQNPAGEIKIEAKVLRGKAKRRQRRRKWKDVRQRGQGRCGSKSVWGGMPWRPENQFLLRTFIEMLAICIFMSRAFIDYDLMILMPFVSTWSCG